MSRARTCSQPPTTATQAWEGARQPPMVLAMSGPTWPRAFPKNVCPVPGLQGDLPLRRKTCLELHACTSRAGKHIMPHVARALNKLETSGYKTGALKRVSCGGGVLGNPVQAHGFLELLGEVLSPAPGMGGSSVHSRGDSLGWQHGQTATPHIPWH